MPTAAKSDVFSKYAFTVLAVILALFIGTYIGSNFLNQSKKSPLDFSQNGDFYKFSQVITQLNSNYFYQDRIVSSQLEDTSIKGLLSGLKDPVTRYYNSQEYTQYKDTLAGNIYGIGVEIADNNGGSKIITVFSNSPAEKAGLQVGDAFVKVNDTDVSKLLPSDITVFVRGAVGTKVTITVLRNGENKTFEITRDKVKTDSIKFINLNQNGICKIDIVRFTDDSAETWESNWDANVAKFISNKCTKLIIDLRNDGGGYIDASKYALEDFVDANTTIFGQKRNDGKIQYVKASRSNLTNAVADRFKDIPTVILVNSNSASASEIFSGALQQLSKAKVVGINSYGKGSFQETFNFSDGSAMVYTTGNWTLPNGEIIDQNFPIKPDYVVVPGDSDFKNKVDSQLDKAKDLLK